MRCTAPKYAFLWALEAICCSRSYQDETRVKPYVDETTGTDLPDDMHDVIAEKVCIA